MKKMNNKGFSLVELIIVIAIMAVLVGVLAPQFLKYVEDSRVQKDESAAAEVLNAVKIALSVEDVYKEAANGETVAVSDGTITVNGNTKLDDELKKTITASEIDFTSKKHDTETYTITISINASAGTVDVKGAWGAGSSTTTP